LDVKQERHPAGFDGRLVAGRIELDALIALALAWFDLTHPCAFVLAMQPRSSGVTASQARWMFADAERRVQ
jgi:hypothetical protein